MKGRYRRAAYRARVALATTLSGLLGGLSTGCSEQGEAPPSHEASAARPDATARPRISRDCGPDTLVWSFDSAARNAEYEVSQVAVPRRQEPGPAARQELGGEREAITAQRVRPQPERLPSLAAADCPPPRVTRIPGSWTVVARRDGSAVLARAPDRGLERRSPPSRATPRGTRTGEPAALEVLIHSPAHPLRSADAETIELSLPGVPVAQSRALSIGRVRLDAGGLYFGIPAAGPLLLPSPTDPDLYLFEEANALWSFRHPDIVRRLTASRVGGFDYHALAARQREGEVILYWASAPVWSPDGRFVAYATNREAVAEGDNGQAVWMLEMATGRERPLLRERGRWFRPFGWLGRELLYTGSDAGVWAIDPQTEARRQVAVAVELGVSVDGSALAVAEGVPEATVIRILSGGEWTTAPPAPAGYLYSAQAGFSPAGGRLLLQATTEQGEVRQFWSFDRQTGEARRVEVSDRLLDGWPTWLDEETLLINQARPTTREPYASMIHVP